MEPDSRLSVLARHVADLVEPGSRIGLGSGSTAEAVIRALGDRVRQGLRVEGVATSRRTERLARQVGIPLIPIDAVDQLDLGIDGADEIDPGLNLTKGRGGALLYEKLVARACRRFLVVAASEKLVSVLGTRIPLPVEVVPFAWRHTAHELVNLGLDPTIRLTTAKGAERTFLTDGGHAILDCRTGAIERPDNLARCIKAIPGVVEHGLFVGMASRAVVVGPDGRIKTLERPTHSE